MSAFVTIALFIAATLGSPPTHSFTVDILDTKNFGDVNTVLAGLQRADGVNEVSVVRSNRNFVKLAGTMEGDAEHLINDIKGLSQDRFSVKARNLEDGTLAITLRRLGPPPAP